MWVAHLMNASGHMKEPATVDRLLGRRKSRKTEREMALKARAEKRMKERHAT